ncbi:dienelactone hydrolase [Candidatus Bathyarchaeota archaeon]|nr:MAG: dienelactone hydrolase [Candidatus Bathyarchaeota archaeon]TMI31318.1 MAG: dienelactone hydrolase [Candidatus Bathyarchaeota archaeon]
MEARPSVQQEKARVKLETGGEMSLAYGVPSLLSNSPTCMVLAHGAGGPMYSPFISYFHTELARKGLLTVKFNFPYMEARKKVPDKRVILEASYRRILEEVRSSKYKPSRMFIGGKSMGGRIASMIVAEGEDVNGLFFLGYPLHPPGRQDRLRDEHLYKIDKPMLFVSGTRDNFANRDLLAKVTAKLPTAKVHWIEGGDHSLNKGNGKEELARTYEEVIGILSDWVSAN